MHVVELGFDFATEIRIRELWNKVARVYGGPQLVEQGPHLSLASFSDGEPDCLRDELGEIGRCFRAFPLAFASIGSFPSAEGVVYLAPLPNTELRRLHEALHHALARHGQRGHEHYRPGNWVPHCTIAIGVPAELRDRVVEECQREVATPIAAVVATVRVTAYGPRRELHTIRFGEP